ncbi:hypothetical protein Phum_PHUM493260 [Pediculus humanus corporis]|uniref:Uncharacterized protein n=1 Tax=Pediculus humanus subsp. corporis TaxID=121224 RepID=E0VX20_PEDHC|nr:uncharacterized protein Phum_PHUM493260 [Pediculus humanus corporis]EEB17926.1 hypothetical protein Phum_PHUM493260 [Pediculus humanus corporis]
MGSGRGGQGGCGKRNEEKIRIQESPGYLSGIRSRKRTGGIWIGYYHQTFTL